MNMTRLRSCCTVLPVMGHRFVLLVLVLTGLACTALFASATNANAATPSTAFDVVGLNSPDAQAFGRFPERLADAGDLDGDGVRDIFAAAYKLDVNGIEDAGKVTLISGATRKVLYSLTSPQLKPEAPNNVSFPTAGGANGPQFGFQISVPGDLNGDGKDDVIVGAPYQDVGPGCGVPAQPEPNGCNENEGKAYAFSGPTGQPLYALDNPNPQADEGVFATFGARLGKAGDITGDRITETIIGAPANDVPTGCSLQTPVPADCRKNEGEAFIFNGRSGKLERPLRIPNEDRSPPTCSASRCGNFSVGQSPGDVDRDGVADQTVSAYSQRRPFDTPVFFGRVYLFSGKTGGVLARIDQPVAGGNAFFGLDDVAPDTPGDVTGDGVPDLYASGFGQTGAKGESSAGRGWVFDGAKTVAAGTGVVAYEPKDPTPRPSEAFGFSASKTDYNKDGRPDLYISGLSGINTETYVFDGRDGSVLKTLALPASEAQAGGTGNSGSGLGYSSRAPGDLNGDGEPDFVAGAPFQDVSGVQDQGKLFFFLSNVPRQNVPGGGGFPLPPGGGGGGSIPPKATVCANSKGVRVIGQTNSGGRVFQGTKGNDRICGTSGGDLITGNGGKDVISGGGGNDRINGGSGNDRVNGGSGKDLISGGSGNDSISGSSGNDRINGNSGRDRISGGSGNDRLNGSTGSDVVSGSSGKDVISGSSGNDRLSGNSGNDRINGNSGNDRISGGSGNDRLKGGSGSDRIDGGPGKDRISGGSGRDRTKQ